MAIDPLTPGPWRIYLDAEITRRKQFHLIVDPHGEVVWRARRMTDCLRWLFWNGVEEYRLCTDGEAYTIKPLTHGRVKAP